jgi:uncharacterized protein YndB with AHSA1/START domain
MINVTGTVAVSRPSAEVFAFLADPANAPKWQSELSHSELLTDGPVRLGSKFKEVIKFLGRPIELICEYVEFEPGHKMVFQSRNSKAMQFDVTFLVEPRSPGAAQVTVASSTRLGGALRLLEPLFAGEIRSASKKELQTLKAAVEAAA